MAVEVILPRQGNTVETCLILEWKKREGDAVQAGDVLVEVETDKATFEIEAPENGNLLKTFFSEGEDVPVLSLLALIGAEGEDVSNYVPADGPPPAEVAAPPAAAATAAPATTAPTAAAPSAAPAAGTLAATVPPATAAAVPVTETPAAEVTGQAAGLSSADRPGRKISISPRARKLAEQKGIAYSGLTGSGPGGRIIERDLLKALQGGQPLTPAAVATAAAGTSGTPVPPAGSRLGGRVGVADLSAAGSVPVSGAAATEMTGYEEFPVKGIRGLIAERMHQSLQTTAQYTLNRSVSAENLLGLRRRIKAGPESMGLTDITVDKMILYAVARLLRRTPELNSHFLGDRSLRFKEVHLGYAVDTPRGLMVPVIRNADSLSLKQIALEARRLQSACLEGKILPDELSGSTFTVSNMGMLGIESFTPVLNIPEVGILGVGGIQLKPVRQGGEVVFKEHLSLSLTANHQAVDGGPAARFLAELAALLSDFDLLLAE